MGWEKQSCKVLHQGKEKKQKIFSWWMGAYFTRKKRSSWPESCYMSNPECKQSGEQFKQWRMTDKRIVNEFWVANSHSIPHYCLLKNHRRNARWKLILDLHQYNTETLITLPLFLSPSKIFKEELVWLQRFFARIGLWQ